MIPLCMYGSMLIVLLQFSFSVVVGCMFSCRMSYIWSAWCCRYSQRFFYILCAVLLIIMVHVFAMVCTVCSTCFCVPLPVISWWMKLNIFAGMIAHTPHFLLKVINSLSILFVVNHIVSWNLIWFLMSHFSGLSVIFVRGHLAY